MEAYKLVELISTSAIQTRVDELAREIDTDYAGRSLVLVGILKGAFVFLADLARRISIPVQIDFVRLSSYGAAAETSGTVMISKEIELPVAGRDVLVVEDIVDTGITLAWYLEHLSNSNPRSVKVCALIDKPERREIEVTLDYIGFRVDKGFLVGYGLDYSERHRNLPGIFEVEFDAGDRRQQ